MELIKLDDLKRWRANRIQAGNCNHDDMVALGAFIEQVEIVEVDMSYWSDGEPFDEYDDPWCEYCKGGESKAQCDACYKAHTAVDEEEPIEEEYAERPTYYEEFLKVAHKRRRR